MAPTSVTFMEIYTDNIILWSIPILKTAIVTSPDMANGRKPAIFLKQGHSLVGKDTFSLVLRLRALETLDMAPEEMASINPKYSLESYSEPEIRTEFRKLTGHFGVGYFGGGVHNESLQSVRAALHVAVVRQILVALL